MIHTMGCKSNQFEGFVIEENLIKSGFEKVLRLEDADFYILNSCSVTQKSDNEALYLLRNAKHKNPNIKTVLTGCVAQIEKERLLQNDFIDYVVGNDEKLEMSCVLARLSDDFDTDEVKILKQVQDDEDEVQGLSNLNLEKVIENKKTPKISCSDIMQLEKFHYARLDDMSKTRASLKIQDGCDNRCSYCIIPFARGKSRSADIDFIIDEINNLVKHGFLEVVFTGIHIGLWGKDFGLSLLDLLKEVEKRTQIKRYRLGSLNPLEITDELLDFLSKSEKFCPHFHLSLQSACNKTLESMKRFYKVEDYLLQIDKINSMFDLPFLGSDIITGFAGETDEDFDITRQNLEKSGLSQIHTFPYSIRKGTVGAEMAGQNPDDVKNSRASVVKAISARKYNEFVEKNIGRVWEVLIEKHADKFDGRLKGVTRNYLTVHLNSDDLSKVNTLFYAKIIEVKDGKIYGELV